uniref:Uncharacterized protein n=1 Tax=Asparagus officinalis TaxID=4686 RepID=Q2XNW4_ASPOF|nr:hypothetical protein (glycine-rich; similar to PsAD1 from P. sativum) [Asparagus officinalis]
MTRGLASHLKVTRLSEGSGLKTGGGCALYKGGRWRVFSEGDFAGLRQYAWRYRVNDRTALDLTVTGSLNFVRAGGNSGMAEGNSGVFGGERGAREGADGGTRGSPRRALGGGRGPPPPAVLDDVVSCVDGCVAEDCG